MINAINIGAVHTHTHTHTIQSNRKQKSRKKYCFFDDTYKRWMNFVKCKIDSSFWRKKEKWLKL